MVKLFTSLENHNAKVKNEDDDNEEDDDVDFILDLEFDNFDLMIENELDLEKTFENLEDIKAHIEKYGVSEELFNLLKQDLESINIPNTNFDKESAINNIDNIISELKDKNIEGSQEVIGIIILGAYFAFIIALIAYGRAQLKKLTDFKVRLDTYIKNNPKSPILEGYNMKIPEYKVLSKRLDVEKSIFGDLLKNINGDLSKVDINKYNAGLKELNLKFDENKSKMIKLDKVKYEKKHLPTLGYTLTNLSDLVGTTIKNLNLYIDEFSKVDKQIKSAKKEQSKDADKEKSGSIKTNARTLSIIFKNVGVALKTDVNVLKSIALRVQSTNPNK